MKIKRLLISAAFSALLNIGSLASAQVLGGSVTGGLGGSITGGLGNIGATGNGAVNGSLGASSDALGRARDAGSRIRDKGEQSAEAARERVNSTAASTTATASGAASATVDSTADATNAVSATADAAGNAGSNADVASGGETGEPSMLDLSGTANGSGSGMLDLGSNPAGQPADVSEPKPSRAQPEGGRGEQHAKPVSGSPTGVVGGAPGLRQCGSFARRAGVRQRVLIGKAAAEQARRERQGRRKGQRGRRLAV
jgi:hypothetical protein